MYSRKINNSGTKKEEKEPFSVLTAVLERVCRSGVWCGMRFGFHVSIQGGLFRAPLRAKALECDCFQIFSQSPRSWSGVLPKEVEARLFREGVRAAGIAPCVIHAPYLLNLAAEDKTILERSRALLVLELRRAALIGAEYVVVHMGTRKANPEEQALALMAESINEVFSAAGRSPVKLLLENTSGGGGKLGYVFAHLAAVRKKIRLKQRVGICLDTAHLFQAGYAIHTKRGLSDTLREFDQLIGLEHVRLLHLNDSLTPFGSRHDRHWHIGQGQIGRRGFKRILRQQHLSHLPAIMETPKDNDTDDQMNMQRVRKWSRENLVRRLMKKCRQPPSSGCSER